MSRTSRKKEKPFDHISLLLMQRRDAVMQPRHLHLKRYVRHLKAVHIQLECSLLSGDRSPVAFVDWWDGFLEPCGLAPPSPSSSSTTGAFHVACIGLQSSQIKFLMRPLSVRKHVNCTLYKLFSPPPPIGESSSRLSPRSKLHPSQPSRVLKAQLRALLISSPLSRLSPSDGLLHLTPLLPQRLVFIAAVWAQWHISPPAPPTPALINSFVLPSARVFPQTNCWQKHLC